MPGVRVVATFWVKEGKQQEILKPLRELVDAVCREPGCIEYDCYVDTKDPLRFTFIETWASEEALKVHSAADALKQWAVAAKDLRDPNSEVRVLKSVWE